jgi:hypothetical protein
VLRESMQNEAAHPQLVRKVDAATGTQAVGPLPWDRLRLCACNKINTNRRRVLRWSLAAAGPKRGIDTATAAPRELGGSCVRLPANSWMLWTGLGPVQQIQSGHPIPRTPTCYADAGVEARAHVRLAELAAPRMRVAHVAVAGLLGRLGQRRRPLPLRCVLAGCLLRWPACRESNRALHKVDHCTRLQQVAVERTGSKDSRCSCLQETIGRWREPGVG